MTPRWPLFAMVLLAGVPLVLPAVLGVFYEPSPAIVDGFRWLGWLLNAVLFVLAVVDLRISANLAEIEVEREVADVMSVGTKNAVRIWLTNRHSRSLSVEFHDEYPQPATCQGLPFTLELPPLRQRYQVYYVQPLRRGMWRFGDIFLRCRSQWGLWTLYNRRSLERPIRVYPDIQAVHGMELLARRNRVAETGVRLSRLHGSGNDFDRLREYRREDEFRHIDWKASARTQKLISREFVVERNQNVLFVLDSGRSMCNELHGISHLDRALNAAIAVGYVALRQGDNVGLLACSNRLQCWVRPVRATAGIQSIIRHTYDLQPDYESTDYGLMVEELRRRYRKRSMVVLLTHALDDLHLEAICRHVRQLRNPHLVLVAFLRNVPLHQRMNDLPTSDVEAFQIAAATEMLALQSIQIAKLQQAGLLVLETVPERLSADLISRYLDIKARHLL